MPNLRIIADNAANRAVIAASSSAGAMLPACMQNDIKSDVWRSVGASATLTLTWSIPEVITGVALCASNLSSACRVRVRGYATAIDVVPVFDTGSQLGCPPRPFGQLRWGREALGMNGFRAGLSIAQIWISNIARVAKLIIDIADPSGRAGYIEVGRIVAGDYWSPVSAADYGASIQVADDSKHSRTEAGDLLTDLSSRRKKLAFSMSYMAADDADRMWQIIYDGGIARPVFISFYPLNADPVQEQKYSLLGKLNVTPVMATPFFNKTSAQIELEEV